MVVDDDDDNNINTQENSKTQFPTVPEEAIVKPEDERPVRMIKRSEEELSGEEDESDIDEAVDSTLDMDGDGSPDWDPAVGPGV
jgi:hypothetical protein